MAIRRITKEMPPVGHVGPRRWMKYIARNEPLIKEVKNPERYLHSNSQEVGGRYKRANTMLPRIGREE